MIKVNRIDHVAIATSLAPALQLTLGSLFGLRTGTVEHVADQKTNAVFLHTPAHGATAAAVEGAALELIAPAGNPSLARFVDKRGTALHHICFEVDDVARALTELKAAGVPLVDEVPRRGARGHWVGFIHPQATGGVLFELCQQSCQQSCQPSCPPSQGDPT